MKKIVKFFLLFFLILYLTSCGGGGSGSESNVEDSSLADFDVIPKANKIELYSEEHYGGNTIAYSFTVKNYPDEKEFFCVLYVDDRLASSGYLAWFGDPSITNPRYVPENTEELGLNKFLFYTKIQAKTVRVMIYERSIFPNAYKNSKFKENKLIGDKTIDISNLEIESDTRTQLKD